MGARHSFATPLRNGGRNSRERCSPTCPKRALQSVVIKLIWPRDSQPCAPSLPPTQWTSPSHLVPPFPVVWLFPRLPCSGPAHLVPSLPVVWLFPWRPSEQPQELRARVQLVHRPLACPQRRRHALGGTGRQLEGAAQCRSGRKTFRVDAPARLCRKGFWHMAHMRFCTEIYEGELYTPPYRCTSVRAYRHADAEANGHTTVWATQNCMRMECDLPELVWSLCSFVSPPT